MASNQSYTARRGSIVALYSYLITVYDPATNTEYLYIRDMAETGMDAIRDVKDEHATLYFSPGSQKHLRYYAHRMQRNTSCYLLAIHSFPAAPAPPFTQQSNEIAYD
jgi:hypothetical protein